MAQKLSKKGRNPGAVDNWLEALGYYRKNVAYDETCLFRAVSEQLFDIQTYHEKVRIDCIQYARKNLHEFSEFFNSQEELIKHIKKLEKHMVVCGNLEIQMISKNYKCNVTLFDATHQQTNYIFKSDYNETIFLCLMNEDHYDAVYQREHIENAGFCQSIVYNLLYENVFEISSVSDIVHGMLYDKTYITTQAEIQSDGKDQDNEKTESETEKNQLEENACRPLNVAPFPFKVAKALDPTIYRNIEYDSWTEVRREMRLGEWYYGDDRLILGTKCIFNDELTEESYDCYIQDIIKNENKCVVYITKLAQKRIVNYSDLSPENDAKPWPLPYRFSKNLNISTPTILSLDKIKLHKRRREKNRSKSESSIHSNNGNVNDAIEHDVNAYVGAPLQMQSNQVKEEHTEDAINDGSSEVLMQDAQCNTSPTYHWETPYYQYPTVITPVMSEPYSWPPTPVSPGVFNFNIRPVMTPIATTPNIPYHYCDMNPPPMYNYPIEQYQYSYQPWTEVQPSTPQFLQRNDQNNDQTKDTVTNQKQPQAKESDCHYSSPQQEHGYESPLTVDQPQSMICQHPMSRMNSQMGLYSPVIPVPPGTPVIYSPPPEVMVPTTPVPTTPVPMYASPIDMPYMIQEQTYSYPTTPNTAWYPVGVNAQGFIFPTTSIPTNAK